MFTIYKTTCLINDKIYIGKHITDDPGDSYLGSGAEITAAILEYGEENFTKEVLFILETEQDMNNKEAELVTMEFCERDDNYNKCPGGHGGWSYINKNKLNDRTGMVHTEASKELISANRTGKLHSEETKKLLSDLQKGKPKPWLRKDPRVLVKQKKDRRRPEGFKHNQVICPHCGKDGGANIMKRHHFDRCKMRA